MYGVEFYAAVRLAVVDEGLSRHAAARRFGIDRRTVKKMLSYSAPPGYRRTKPVRRTKLDGFTGIVDAILEADTDPDVPRKQRHRAHRIFERLRAMSTGSRSRSAPRSSPAIGAPMPAATSSTTRRITCRCWRRSRAPWTRRRRCGDGSSIRPSTRCACTKTSRNGRWRPRWGSRAPTEYHASNGSADDTAPVEAMHTIKDEFEAY